MATRTERPNSRNRDYPIGIIDKGYADNKELWEQLFGKAYTSGSEVINELQEIVIKLKELGVKTFTYYCPHGGNFWIDEVITQEFHGSYTTRKISEWTDKQLLVAKFCDIYEYGYCYGTGVNAIPYELGMYDSIEGIERLDIGTSHGSGIGINIK